MSDITQEKIYNDNVAGQTFIPSLVDRHHHDETKGSGDPNKLQEALILSGKLGKPDDLSPYARALAPLLMALNWKGQFRQLCESLPQSDEDITQAELRNILARLGFLSDKVDVSLNNLDKRLIPCLYTSNDGTVYTVLAQDDFGTTVFNTALDRADIIEKYDVFEGQAIVFYDRNDASISEKLQNRLPRSGDKNKWSSYVFRRFSGLWKQALAMSFVINLLGLATPFLVMAVMGIVVSTQNLNTLVWFCLGAVLAVGSEIVLRRLRGKVMGTISSRLNHIFSVSLFDKILHLPLSYTEGSTVSSQMARLRDYMSVGYFINGSLMTALLDLPFTIILLGVMALFSLKMAGLTALSMGVFAVIAFSMKKIIRRSVINGADANVRKQEMIIETIENRDMLLRTNGVDSWLDQYRNSCGRSAKSSMRVFVLGAVLENTGYMVTMLSGVAILSVGIFDVLDGNMPIGALIGAIILLWRIVNPIQSVLSNIPKFEQVASSIKQIDRLMSMDAENDGHINSRPIFRFNGNIKVSRVSLRHSMEADPALLSVDFESSQGDMIAITGENGSGKSTFLKVIAGLYRPQAGQVQIDDVDIRQMSSGELRHAIGYMPQKSALLPGTIASNLRFADPTATEKDIRNVMKFVQGWEAIERLPLGLNTKIRDDKSHEIPDSLAQKIALARTMIGQPGVLLIDEIEGVFTHKEKVTFLNNLKEMSVRPTVLFSTQDDEIIRASDYAFVFKKGGLSKVSDMPIIDNEPTINQ